MAENIEIAQAPSHVGETVIIEGQLHMKLGRGKLRFLQVRDGGEILQCLVLKKDVAPDVFEMARLLSVNSSILVTGVICSNEHAPGVPGGVEMYVMDLKSIQSDAPNSL